MTDNGLLALVLAPLALAAVAVLISRPLTVTLPFYAAVLPVGGLLAVGSSRFSSLSSILGLLLVAGLLAQVAAGHRTTVPISLTVPLWLLFLGVAGATTLWSVDAATTAAGFVVLGSLLAVFVLVSTSPVDRLVLRRTENGLLVGGTAVVCYGVAQLLFLGGLPAHVPGSSLDTGGRFGNDLLGADNEAVALLLPLVIALSRSVTRRSTRSQVLYLGLAAFMLLGILMTGSRGGILASIVAGVVLAFATPQGRRRLLTYTAVGLMLGAVVFFLHPLGIAERTVATSSSSGRLSIWRVGIAACPQYCALGSGWETFPDVYAKTQPSVANAQVLVGKGGSYQPHNVILLVAIELGIPGLILLFAVLAATVADALRLPVRMRGPPLGALLGTWFAAMFLSNLEYKFFWMALVMVALSRNVAESEPGGSAVDARGWNRLPHETQTIPPEQPQPH